MGVWAALSRSQPRVGKGPACRRSSLWGQRLGRGQAGQLPQKPGVCKQNRHEVQKLAARWPCCFKSPFLGPVVGTAVKLLPGCNLQDFSLFFERLPLPRPAREESDAPVTQGFYVQKKTSLKCLPVRTLLPRASPVQGHTQLSSQARGPRCGLNQMSFRKGHDLCGDRVRTVASWGAGTF